MWMNPPPRPPSTLPSADGPPPLPHDTGHVGLPYGAPGRPASPPLPGDRPAWPPAAANPAPVPPAGDTDPAPAPWPAGHPSPAVDTTPCTSTCTLHSIRLLPDTTASAPTVMCAAPYKTAE